MKTLSIGKWGLAVAAAALSLTGCAPKTAQSAPATLTETQLVTMAAAVPGVAASEQETNVPALTGVGPMGTNVTDVLEIQLEDAPATLVSGPATPSQTSLSAPASELVRLAQAGVDEGVMLAFVTNSPRYFALNSEDVIYLNDLGVPESVVTAMLQQDQVLRSSGSQAAGTPPVYTNDMVQETGAPVPYEATTTVTEAVSEPAVQYAQQPVNVSYTYFYDSLAPYGSWVDVSGYGLCWRPTVVVLNRNWHPYSDRGRWLYSDSGWYWYSDYSWGWAPFHYGRWFRHNRWGWCWAPDTVWGPAWVSWRFNRDFCGWAPLPPAACYTPTFGITYFGNRVGFGFGFGLRPHHYTFVPTHRFYDRHLNRYRVHGDQVGRIFERTQVANRIERDRNNRIINRGLPVERIAEATGRRLDPVRIRETERPTLARLERGPRGEERSLAVYRPELPQPERPTRLVGAGVRPAARDLARNTAASELNRPPNRDLSIDTRPGGRDATRTMTRSTRSVNGALDLAPGAGTRERENANPQVSTRPTGRNLQARQPGEITRTDPDRNGQGRATLTPSTPAQTQPVPRANSRPEVVRRDAVPRVQQPQRTQTTSPRVEAMTPRQTQRVFRQEPIRVQPQVIPQPAPVQRQAPRQMERQAPPQVQRSMPVTPQPRIEQRQQPVRIAPPVQRSQPVIRSQPAPRMESRPAPVQRSAPSIQSRPAPAPAVRQAPSGGMGGGATRSAPQRMEGSRSPGRGGR